MRERTTKDRYTREEGEAEDTGREEEERGKRRPEEEISRRQWDGLRWCSLGLRRWEKGTYEEEQL